MTKKEFLSITSKCFGELGCKQYNKLFVYEHKDMYIIFMLIKSNYSDCYYLDYNCSIKALHSEFILSDKNYDIILQPRLKLINGVSQFILEELDLQKYEEDLMQTLKAFLEEVDRKGLLFIKELERKGQVLENNATEFLKMKR